MQTNQIKLHSVNASALFTQAEAEIKRNINTIKYYEENITSYNKQLDNHDVIELKEKLESAYSELKSKYDNKSDKDIIKELKRELKAEIKSFKDVRKLDEKQLTDETVITQFESEFTRTLQIETNALTDKFIVIEITYYDILKQLLENGFTYNDKRYIFAFASAGQIRDKKIICVKEEEYKTVKGKLFAGLTDDEIEKKGIVINKLIAYKALCNSSSVRWEDVFGNDKPFNLNEVIVIPDFEHTIREVDYEYIDAEYKITKVEKEELVNPVTDGAGFILPSYFGKLSEAKNLQIRSSFVKGILIPFDWVKFAKDKSLGNNIDLKTFKVKDAWGNLQSLVGIKIILTESQFKMRKYYNSWEDFKEKFKDNTAAIVDIESNNKKDFKDATISYQMIQTLHDMTNEEIDDITSFTRNKIQQIIKAANPYSLDEKGNKVKKSNKQQNEDNNLLLGVAGANIKHKRSIHKALNLTDELLKDKYIKSKIADVRDNLISDAKSGSLIMEGSRTMLILPDVIAFGQHLFGLEVKGGLEKDEVSCKLFDDDTPIDMLRSPHLYIEHHIAINKIKKKYKDYYTTLGIYTSVNSTSSHELAYDVDGDKAVCIPMTEKYKSSHTYVKVAKRHLKMHDIKPLAYEMSKGTPVKSIKDNTYEALTKAFSANIGLISNRITKVFNKASKIDNNDIHDLKLLKYLNNQEIDFAKTLYRTPIKDGGIKNRLSSIDIKVTENKDGKKEKINVKVPHFFIEAKNKKKNDVEPINDSVMNKIYRSFNKDKFGRLPSTRDKFDFTLFMQNKEVEIDDAICERYDTLIDKYAKQVQAQIMKQNKGKKNYGKVSKIDEFYEKMTDGCKDVAYLVDVLIKYLYDSPENTNKSRNMFLIWESKLGDILLHNLEKNLLERGKATHCLGCNVVIDRGYNNKKECCVKCATIEIKRKNALLKAKSRNKQAS